ncbi:MAG: hypothetical protein DME94_03535, partial [Verrucomicrobia bacterium]
TVGSIHGGTKHNIIPDEVKMQLTVRTYKADTRERVLAAIDQIAKGCAIAAGIPPDRVPIVSVAKDQFTPATYNNPELTKRLVAIWRKSLGNENVEIVDPTMGGEDFSEYSLPDHSIPAVDFHVGAVDPAKIAQFKKEGKELPSLHSSKFAPVAGGSKNCSRHGCLYSNSLYLDVFPQIGRHVEIFAFDDGRFAFFKSSARDRLELQNFLFCGDGFCGGFLVSMWNRFLVWHNW